MVLTEPLDFIERKGITRKMEPRVDEHTTMTSRENETITIDPLRISRVVLKEFTPEDSTNLSSTKRKTQVTRVGSSNGV